MQTHNQKYFESTKQQQNFMIVLNILLCLSFNILGSKGIAARDFSKSFRCTQEGVDTRS